jgi:hypothetical protein
MSHKKNSFKGSSTARFDRQNPIAGRIAYGRLDYNRLNPIAWTTAGMHRSGGERLNPIAGMHRSGGETLLLR